MKSITLHQTLDFCAHWVCQLVRKLRGRKNQGYCYVVIRALDCKYCANFKKTSNFEGSYTLWLGPWKIFLDLDSIVLGKFVKIIGPMAFLSKSLALYKIYRVFQNIQGKNPFLHGKIWISRKFWVYFWLLPPKPRKNRGFDPQISRVVYR